ncbi:hypothetical protein FALBO_7599 [Fusarium albosuccineum]|uniref:Uncharacterized protein n=1 Tax=Fusarium albosuccineum TaxID=1237068 RepID=A0A8H4LCD5_9HYPO|nr:hypothetical protein FALBO_7599 [Fusarium albosuccineum]
MGMQGPLTAQALGRSPYDDVVDWDGDAGDQQNGEPAQQYDHRGRPTNPDTKRINRDIIRSHNEVMLVIGVAEQENPNSNPEAESNRRHAMYEEDVGFNLAVSALRCVEAVGAFGLDGLRQRILIYKRYSHIPFWSLYQQSRKDFSFTRNIMAGAPTSLLSSYTERQMSSLWRDRPDRVTALRFVHEVWSYVRVNLELYAALQRLGIISSSNFLPGLSFFIPFTQGSPIPAPPPLTGFSVQSILQWVGGVCISAAPFLVWVMTQRMVRDWRPQFWGRIFRKLPNTGSPGIIPTWVPAERATRTEQPQSRGVNSDASPLRAVDGQVPSDGPVEAVRRASTFSARGDEYDSDEEDNEGVSATLISFDVEASESNDAAPPGLWSAELRASASDARSALVPQTTYYDTMLTQLPPLIATHVFSDAVIRLLTAPYEAMALRLVARTFLLRLGLPCSHVCGSNLLSHLNLTSATNFLATQVIHLALCGEIWAGFTAVATFLHTTPEEWREAEEDEKAAGWSDE